MRSDSRPAGAAPPAPDAWRAVATVAVAVALAMGTWFAGAVVAAPLAAQWGLSTGATATLAIAVQLGFVAGTALAAVLNLADVVPSRWYFVAGAVAAAAANATLLAASGFGTAVGTRLLTGAALAAVYPPAMKMVSTWVDRGRGLAIAVIVGALTLGKAVPSLVQWRSPVDDVRRVVLAASLGALLAAALVAAGYRDGPHAFPSRRFSWALVGTVVRVRRWRAVTGGYLGHMWELYAFWTWVAAFVGASAAGWPPALAAFGAIAIGAAGCVAGGWLADRVGAIRVVRWAMALSGSCALLSGVAFARGGWVLAAVLAAWGVSVIADSAQFSALVTRAVPAHAVGTALTLQVSLGFLLTVASIELVPWLAARVGWQWSFALLAAGPALGLVALRAERA